MKISPGLETIIKQIRMLGNAIIHASSSQQVEAMIFELEMLGARPEAKESDIARHLVFNYVRLGYTVCGELKFAEAKADQQALQNSAHAVFPVNRMTEPLAASLQDLKIWNKDELKRLESINPAAFYDIVVFGDDGTIVGMEKISGARLRDSAALVKAYAHKGELDETGTRRLNDALYGPAGHQDDPERIVAGLRKVKRAFKDVAGDTAAHAKTPEEKQRIQQETKKTLREFDTLERLHLEKPAAPAPQAKPAQPGVPAAAGATSELPATPLPGNVKRAKDAVISKAEKDLAASLQACMDDWARVDEPTGDTKQAAGKRPAPAAAAAPQTTLIPPAPPANGVPLH